MPEQLQPYREPFANLIYHILIQAALDHDTDYLHDDGRLLWAWLKTQKRYGE